MAGLLLKFQTQFDPFLQLFLDNSGTAVAVLGILVGNTGFQGLSRDAKHAEYCDETAQFMRNPWPPDTPCIKDATNLAEIVYGHVLTGTAVAMVSGSIYYAFMGGRLARSTGRQNVCIMPYGINTPAAFLFLFAVVFRAAGDCIVDNSNVIKSHFEAGTVMSTGELYAPNDVLTHAWQVGCVANMVAGVISVICGLAGPVLVKVVPKPALFACIAGVAFTFLGLAQFQTSFEYGRSGIVPLVLMMLIHFGRITTGPIPGSIVIVVVGALMGWGCQEEWPGGGSGQAVQEALSGFGFYMPRPPSADSLATLGDTLRRYLGIILPTSLTGSVLTLMCVYAAHEASDHDPIQETMVIDGLTTVVAGAFGSPFGTCVYMGHAAYKARGGKGVYSLMNAAVFSAFALTGSFAVINALIPPAAIAPIILFVGFVVTAQAFRITATPFRHLPCVTIALFPVVCEFTLNNFRTPPYHPGSNFSVLQNLSRGSILNSLFWCSFLIHAIDRRFITASLWAFGAAVFAALGLIHAERVFDWRECFWHNPIGTAPISYTIAYVGVALLFLLLHAARRYVAYVQRCIPAPEIEDSPDSPDSISREIVRWMCAEQLECGAGKAADGKRQAAAEVEMVPWQTQQVLQQPMMASVPPDVDTQAQDLTIASSLHKMSRKLLVAQNSLYWGRGAEPPASAIHSMAQLYNTLGRDPGLVAEATGCDERLLALRPPADVVDFATKLFQGYYTCTERPATEEANALPPPPCETSGGSLTTQGAAGVEDGRDEDSHQLYRPPAVRVSEVKVAACKLRAVQVDEAARQSRSGPPSEANAVAAPLYADCGGSEALVAEAKGCDEDVFRARPLENVGVFGKNILQGGYTYAEDEAATAAAGAVRATPRGRAGPASRCRDVDSAGMHFEASE